jgi:hypothetical protein
MVCTSTAEAETHAIMEVAKEIIWVSKVVQELSLFAKGFGVLGVPKLFTDNQPALDSLLHGKGRTKHYDIRIKFLAASVRDGSFELLKVATERNLADVFTKAVRKTRFKDLCSSIMIGGNSAEHNFRGGVRDIADEGTEVAN